MMLLLLLTSPPTLIPAPIRRWRRRSRIQSPWLRCMAEQTTCGGRRRGSPATSAWRCSSVLYSCCWSSRPSCCWACRCCSSQLASQEDSRNQVLRWGVGVSAILRGMCCAWCGLAHEDADPVSLQCCAHYIVKYGGSSRIAGRALHRAPMLCSSAHAGSAAAGSKGSCRG